MGGGRDTTCTHEHDSACGYVEPVTGHPCEYVCEICSQKDEIGVSAWEWVDEESYLVWNEENGQWILALPGASAENLVTVDILAQMLPAQITAYLADGTEQMADLIWDFSSFPEEGAYEGSYLIQASLSQEYVLGETAMPLSVTLDLGGAELYALDPAILESHKVLGIDPDETTVNLFDYWVDVAGESPTAPNGDILSKEPSMHWREDGSKANFSGPDNWNRGINENHLLLFGDGVVHGGLWNKGAGESTDYGKTYAGMENIVKPILKDGYPEINVDAARQKLTGDQTERDWTLIKDWKLSIEQREDPNFSYAEQSENVQNLSETVIANWENRTGQTIDNGTESLDYLFDPEKDHSNKQSYTNVKGLFQLDDEGYYYYNMRENFAEYNKDENRFTLYDAPATVRTDGIGSVGNFFPFNSGSEVFDGVVDGKLTSSIACSSNTMNHHLGMTIDMDFRQPTDGKVNIGAKGKAPMTFKFAGDDDIWIFIDDVLVLDLGGVHSELYGTIDFATGDIYIGRGFGDAGNDGIPENPAGDKMVTHTTLRDTFRNAGMEDSRVWTGNTFASNTNHTLKLFYLERGNYDSSLALRFNLQPRLYQQIKKVDQNGNPIQGVEFELYDAKKVDAGTENAFLCTNVHGRTSEDPIYVAQTGSNQPIATLKTGENGIAPFVNSEISTKDGVPEPFNFADRYNEETGEGEYYILKECNAPAGYRTLPIDVVLEYNPETTMLSVSNRWMTGAYASFISTIAGNNTITYGHYNPATGNVESNPAKLVPSEIQEKGLVVAIPMLLLQQRSQEWAPLYGDNVNGFQAVTYDHEDPDQVVDNWRGAALKAILYQSAKTAAAADTQDKSWTADWHLTWNEEERHLEGTLSDLPGNAARYRLNNAADADMRMEYAMITPEALAAVMGADHVSSDHHEMYLDLGRCVNQLIEENGKTLDEAVEEIAGRIRSVSDATTGSGFGFSFLNVDQFNRNFRSLIYVPNEQRELRVWKVDQDGKSVNGVMFALYDNPDCAGTPVSQGTTANVGGQDGMLVFAPYNSEQDGYAKMEWANSLNTEYYLKEISAPAGYHLNPTVIPVIVGTYSIYADAGTAGNGVTVMAGVGKLIQTMTKYAFDGDVNITLRDITAYAQVQDSGKFDLNGWTDMALSDTSGQVKRSMNLHYKRNAMIDYGLHDRDGGKNFLPFFVTDTGFLRTRVEQNSSALEQDMYEALSQTYWDDLGSIDITSLFSLLNLVVVTDQTEPDTQTGELVLSKKVVHAAKEDDYSENFLFTITLVGPDGKALEGEYYFYGTDKSGYIENGSTIPLHHDESITILGLPAGTKYTVTEAEENGWYVHPKEGTITGTIVEGKMEEAAFTNSREGWKTGSLSISKTVTGKAGDQTKEFHFTVTLTGINGSELPDSYHYTGSKNGTLRSGDTISLKSGESITIEQLVAGTEYTVTEAEANKDGYETTSTNESGTILDDESIAVAFTNHRDSENPPSPPDGPDSPDNPDKPNNPDTPNSSDTPKTGDRSDMRLWTLLGTSALLSVCMLFGLKRKAKKSK